MKWDDQVGHVVKTDVSRTWGLFAAYAGVMLGVVMEALDFARNYGGGPGLFKLGLVILTITIVVVLVRDGTHSSMQSRDLALPLAPSAVAAARALTVVLIPTALTMIAQFVVLRSGGGDAWNVRAETIWGGLATGQFIVTFALLAAFARTGWELTLVGLAYLVVGGLVSVLIGQPAVEWTWATILVAGGPVIVGGTSLVWWLWHRSNRLPTALRSAAALLLVGAPLSPVFANVLGVTAQVDGPPIPSGRAPRSSGTTPQDSGVVLVHLRMDSGGSRREYVTLERGSVSTGRGSDLPVNLIGKDHRRYVWHPMVHMTGMRYTAMVGDSAGDPSTSSASISRTPHSRRMHPTVA